jgi:molybdenum cofactor synthesis domain-containing protein
VVEKKIRAAVLTVSTRSSRGERKDKSGPVLCGRIEETIGEVIHYSVVGDDRERIVHELLRVCDELSPDVLFTLGGTGLAPSDVTPEATESVLERKAPGISELIRLKGYEKTPMSFLSRGVAGVRGKTLIINMPGSPRAALECFDAVLPVLSHAVELIHGEVKDCGRV